MPSVNEGSNGFTFHPHIHQQMERATSAFTVQLQSITITEKHSFAQPIANLPFIYFTKTSTSTLVTPYPAIVVKLECYFSTIT